MHPTRCCCSMPEHPNMSYSWSIGTLSVNSPNQEYNDAQQQIKLIHFYRNFIGKALEVLVESSRHAATGLLKGVSSNYIPVLIDADDDQINKLVTVRLTDQIDNALMGTIVNT